MTADKNNPPPAINCKECQAQLAQYVREELANEPAELTHPAVTAHIESCAACEAAYYHEFRSQGRRRSLSELRQVGERSAVAGTLAHILSPAAPATENASDWRETAVEHGRAWFDRATGQMRQARLWLADLLQPPPMAPVLAGWQGQPADEAESATLRVDVADGVELVMRLLPTPAAQPDLADLQIAVSLPDRFGDYSGIQVTLQSPNESRSAVTDELGKVTFAGIVKSSITHMQVLIQAPE